MDTMATIWFATVGITGFMGNGFVIAVTSMASRLNSSHLMIIWLGCTDLISCLLLPLRYKLIYQTTTVSPTLCIVGRSLIMFTFKLNIQSLVMVAIERYKAVQNINRCKQKRCKFVLSLIFLSISLSAIFSIPPIIIWVKLYNNNVECRNFDSADAYSKVMDFIRLLTPLYTLSEFILIAVLYLKIGVLVRTQIGPSRSSQCQQVPHRKSLSVEVESSNMSQRKKIPSRGGPASAI